MVFKDVKSSDNVLCELQKKSLDLERLARK